MLGAALRFYELDRPELWMDENCTWYFVCDASAFDFRSKTLLYENASRLYYMLLAGWTILAGQDPWGLRSFSALLGTLTVPLMALWLRCVAGPAPAAMAAAITADHPLHVYYSREARFYPLWIVELICLLWTALLAARTDRRRYWVAYAGLFLAALWTHYFSLFLLPLAAILPFVCPQRPRQWRRWCLAHLAVAGLFAPWFFSVVVPLSGRGNGDWIAYFFRDYPPWAAIPRTFAAFAPGGFYPSHVSYLPYASETARPAAMAGVVLLLAAAVAFVFPTRRAMLERKQRTFFIMAALVPLLSAWLYSLLKDPFYVVARYDLIAWPLTMVVLCVGLVELARRAGGSRAALLIAGTAAVVTALSITLIAVAAVRVTKTPRRELISYLKADFRPDDRVIAFGVTRWDLCYYRAALWPGAPVFESYPAATDEHVGWSSPPRQLRERPALVREAAERAAAMRRTMSPGSTVWILLQGYDLERGLDDPPAQVDIIMIEALEAAGAVDRPTDGDLPILALTWPSDSR